MTKLIEVRIDLNNCIQEVITECFNIEKETDKHYTAKVDEWNRKERRFLKGTLNKVLYTSSISYYYRFIINEEDYIKILQSEEMKIAVNEIYKKLKKNLEYYTRTLEERLNHYNRNYNAGGN